MKWIVEQNLDDAMMSMDRCKRAIKEINSILHPLDADEIEYVLDKVTYPDIG